MYNGGVFLGLNGVCVKSHGGTDEIGFANAIAVAINMVSENMIDKIIEHFENFDMAAKLASSVENNNNNSEDNVPDTKETTSSEKVTG